MKMLMFTRKKEGRSKHSSQYVNQYYMQKGGLCQKVVCAGT